MLKTPATAGCCPCGCSGFLPAAACPRPPRLPAALPLALSARAAEVSLLPRRADCPLLPRTGAGDCCFISAPLPRGVCFADACLVDRPRSVLARVATVFAPFVSAPPGVAPVAVRFDTRLRVATASTGVDAVVLALRLLVLLLTLALERFVPTPPLLLLSWVTSLVPMVASEES